jgi:urease accessory protein
VCHSVILHTAEGCGRRSPCCDFNLLPNAHALITTAAAGKIYRSNGLEARQSIQIQVAAGACLEWLPQETIVFNGAIYRQNMRVELTPGAFRLGNYQIWSECSGERFCRGLEIAHRNLATRSSLVD